MIPPAGKKKYQGTGTRDERRMWFHGIKVQYGEREIQ